MTPASPPSPDHRVVMAWQLLQKGNANAAEDIVRPMLAFDMNGELVPLLAMIRLNQGCANEAALLLEQAREKKPRDAGLALVHGIVLSAMAQIDRAIFAYQTAIKCDPDLIEAYMRLGDAQQKRALLEEAQATYQKLLRIQPDNLDANIALSSVLAGLGRFAQAETALRRALAIVTDAKLKAVLYSNLSTSLCYQDKYLEALESLDCAQTLASDLPNFDNRRIEILHKLGRFEDCVLQYQKLLERDPANPQLHQAFNSLLYRMGRMDDFLISYERAPQTRQLMLGKAQTLTLQKRGAEAHKIYADILSRDPGDLTAAKGVAASLLIMGHFQDSLAAFEALTQRPDANADIYGHAAEAALLNADPDKAEYFCDKGLQIQPHHQLSLALLATAWRSKNDPREEALSGYDTLIKTFDLDPPDGFSNADDFNAELGLFLESEHPNTREYLEQTVRGGTQTAGHLFSSNHKLLRQLQAAIDSAVLRYIAELPYDDHHPFLQRRSSGFDYYGSWSSRLTDQGFHVNHMHPHGWISSCYYVVVPDVAKDQDSRQGWIKFGEPPFKVQLSEPMRRTIQPRPGMLVLFPSFTWHGTVPFHANAVRTTIAFDAVPKSR